MDCRLALRGCKQRMREPRVLGLEEDHCLARAGNLVVQMGPTHMGKVVAYMHAAILPLFGMQFIGS
jgi:hypothetical protein